MSVKNAADPKLKNACIMSTQWKLPDEKYKSAQILHTFAYNYNYIVVNLIVS